MTLYYYTQAHTARYDFYRNRIQIKFHKNYKKLLSTMPNGVILLDKTNMPIFYNKTIGKIIAKRSGHSSLNSCSIEEQQKNINDNKDVFFI